jgi:hypothetical protein
LRTTRDPEPVPRLLPADVADFTGRAEQVTELTRILASSAGTQVVRICVVDGPAGVGKTALAVHVAQQLRDRFPGGQLYVDLHGVGEHPVDPSHALGRFLRVLGVPDRELPGGVEERAELYRSRLGDRRVLVVLDDAADAGQVRPLLPGGPGSAVLVTSRRRIPGLVGARQLHLDLLEPDAALTLLGLVAGPGRRRPRCRSAGRRAVRPAPAGPYGSRAPGWPRARTGRSTSSPTSSATSGAASTSSSSPTSTSGRS